MPRVLFIVAVCLFAVQATGSVMLMDEVCETQCEDEAPAGSCDPGCAGCVCCAHPRVTALLFPRPAAPIEVCTFVDWPALVPPDSADPGDIFDVPKLLRS